jgi:CRISPR-associated protein (TIGR03986 family)
MWIETEIKEIKLGKKNHKVVHFSAKRPDGENWAMQEHSVQQGLDMKPNVGLAVRIQVEDIRVIKVERNQQKATILPYGFIPIDVTRAVTDTPIYHDGSNAGELLSGEILCELEALTPLLPGNARYAVSDADQQRLQQWGFSEVNEKKQIAEPLRLKDGRVVIAGSALKGMIRHSLGALTSAPMERVAERHFTYRPNLDFNNVRIKEKYKVRPALIVAKRDGGWDLEVFNDARDASFVRQGSHPRPNSDQRIASYKGGIDGEGLLAGAFTPPTYTYKIALVPKQFACKAHLSADLYQRYLDDQKDVLSNSKTGHLTAHPSNFDVSEVANAIQENSKFVVGQLIYVELKVDKNGNISEQSQVVSCGHHFRYRWAYTSSIRQQNNQLRPCLTPLADEQTDGKPERLTGARLLFGYVRDDKTNPIGKGVYERLAGRIAINHAVSDGVPLFLGDEENNGYCIPLKILGQPKPSAWEFYLQQPSNSNQPLKTYGDLFGDAGGELSGRKFYRHQPNTNELNIKANDDKTINSDQATLGRFICHAGTRFRFAIRFARLREWELGALLAVLEPHQLASNDNNADDYAHKLGLGRPLGMGSVKITRKAIRVRQENTAEFFDSMQGNNVAASALASLKDKLDNNVLTHWRTAHRFIEGQRLVYPTAETTVDGQRVKTIFAWHTDIRRKYSQLRRQKTPTWSDLSIKE